VRLLLKLTTERIVTLTCYPSSCSNCTRTASFNATCSLKLTEFERNLKLTL